MKNIVLAFFLSIFLVGFSYSSIKDVSFTDLNGKVIKIDQFRGKITVLVFWQLYCHSCKKELPAVSQIAKKYKGKAEFYAVVIGTSDILQIEERKREWKFDLPVLIAGYEARSAFGIFGTPITVILDKNLNVVKKVIGSGKEKIIIKTLNKLVQQ